MERNVIVGIVIIACGLGGMTYLTLWSRNTIERIAKKQFRSIRQIVKELKHGR